MIWTLLLLPLIPACLRFLTACHVSLINLRSADSYSILPFSPTELSVADVVLVIGLFIARTVKKSIHRGGSRRSPSDQTAINKQAQEQNHDADLGLPSLELAMPLHIRLTSIDQYLTAVPPTASITALKKPSISRHAFLTSNRVHQILFLSAVSEPALLLLLARKGCPIEPLGAVNARNRFELLQPQLARRIIQEATLLQVPNQKSSPQHLENSVLASLPSAARRVKRGIEIDITVSIYSRVQLDKKDTSADTNSSAPRWSDNVEVFRQVFTILQFVSPSPSDLAIIPNSPTSTSTSSPTLHGSTTTTTTTTTAAIHLSKSAPLSWSKLSKDYNPIHISTIAAQAFGFKGLIAHGNHVVARALEALTSSVEARGNDDDTVVNGVEGSDNDVDVDDDDDDDDEDGDEDEDEEADAESSGSGKWWMDVRFKRPVVVPCELVVREVPPPHQSSQEISGAIGSGGEGIVEQNKRRKVEVVRDGKVYVEIEMGGLGS